MRLPAILHLQAILVVVGIQSSFGGDEKCFGEYQFRYDYAKPFDVNTARFVMRGPSGMCLAVYMMELDSVGISFSDAANLCAGHHENGTLLTNKGFEAFNLNMPQKDSIQFSASYIDISPAPPTGCWVIDSQRILGVEVNCSRPREGFICEYPRQSVCWWEMLTKEKLVNASAYSPWRIYTMAVYEHNVDGSITPCGPPVEYIEVNPSDTLINCSIANGLALFKDEWSEWSQCGKCGDKNRPSNQSRHQEVIDQCKQFADGFKRNNTRSCPPLKKLCAVKPEEDDENTSEAMKATTSNGVRVAVILPSHMLIFLFFLSML